MSGPSTVTGRANTSGARGGVPTVAPIARAPDKYERDNEQHFRAAMTEAIRGLRQSVAVEKRGLAVGIVTSDADYTLTLADRGGIVEMDLAGANTLTVPPGADVDLPISTSLEVVQVGAGTTTLTPGAGVTIQSAVGLVLAAQWSVARLYKRAADEWVASGDLVP